MPQNTDQNVVEGFGDEWSRFDQSALSPDELDTMFENYFSIFPWDSLPTNAVGFDLGCGSGRWARLVVPRVGKLHLIDPSDAIDVARRNLANEANCEFHRAGVEAIPLEANSCDFGYSLGVLHHVPDTRAGLQACVDKLKVGAPFLLYLYYRFDNRPRWFRAIWKVSDVFRRIISKLPHGLRFAISQIIAAVVYFPLARGSKLLERMGVDVTRVPLSQYRDNSFYTMRTDALDRFGTRLEQRFTKVEIEQMMVDCGLRDIVFSERSFWTAVGFKK
ncbi:MAG: class I SAM-dependent methyltransferase [Pyrinomonadaceae bacterium]|nr:class I SAM-dependent methyltransferase [Pyrinomonadaceae bacterium]MBP6214044.1 class I SAM-dependent methyltransferase [Pyrinomonadaceae bacterium]